MKILDKKAYRYQGNIIKGENGKYYDPYVPVCDLKYSIELDDGNVIQSAIFINKRNEKEEVNICVSSQAGCKFKCRFCVSGKNGFYRNLTSEEISSQIGLLLKDNNIKYCDSIVFMGIGDPLDNFDNFISGLKIIRDKKYCPSDNIAIATVGIKEKIDRLIQSNERIEIWFSLHATTDEKRSLLMPINNKYNIENLIRAALKYSKATKNKVWFNYMLFKGFNDTAADIKRLVDILLAGNGKFALIITQPTHDLSDFKRCSSEELNIFEDKMSKLCEGIEISRFFPAGSEIGAGCGQFSFMPRNE